MADIPFLGCKISLISKCDIRYEGILYCVDPKESTIALSKVKSYGTETRGDPSNYVAPKNDVYDIIIFRASDVKDLRVDAPEPPGLSDPAIISARQSSTAFDGITNGSLPTSSGPTQQPSQRQQPTQQKPLLPFLPTGSNKDQPQSQSQQQPTNYSSAAANAQRRPRPDATNKRSEQQNLNNKKNEGPANRGDIHGFRRDNRRDERREDGRDDRRDDRRNDDRRNERRVDERRGDDRRAGPDRRDVEARRGDGNRPARVSRGGYHDRNHVNPNPRYNNPSNYNARRGPNNHRDENSKGPVPYRRGPPPGRRGRSGDRTGAPRGSRKPVKFDSEYDFDEANKQFLELESKLKGMKIKGEGDKDGESSGDRANSKSPGGHSESGSGYDSEDHNKDGDSKEGSVTEEFYDKTKSFFDNISCEASERSQGKVNKPDWRKERQLNAETFGISANYRRGGYRGRSYGANGYHRR